MIRTQVYLHDQQYHMAKLIARMNGFAFSDFIRRGVDMAIKESERLAAGSKKNNAKKKAGALHGVLGKYSCVSSSDIATTHNDIYDL